MAAFSVYWSERRLSAWQKEPVPLQALFGGPHISQPSFIRAGVSPDDTLFIISVSKGLLKVHATTKVSAVSSAADAYRRQGVNAPANRLWAERAGISETLLWGAVNVTCADHVVDLQEMTVPRFDLALPPDALRRFRYLNQRGQRVPKGVETGRVTSPLAFQGIYRLHEDSARDLTDLLDGKLEPSKSGMPTPRTVLSPRPLFD